MKLIITIITMISASFALANADIPLKGIGLYSDLSAKYYYGALYIEDASLDADEIVASNSDLRMEMRFIADKVSKRRFTKLFNDMIAINNSGKTIRQFTDEILDFTQTVQGDLLYGDRMEIIRQEGNLSVKINGVLVMESNNPDFANVLLRGWIGLLPPTPSFKRHVLSLDENPHVIAYETLDQDISRKAVVAKWLTPVRVALLEQQQVKEEEIQEEKQLAKVKQAVQKQRVIAKTETNADEKAKQLALQREKERELERQRIENERKRQARLAALKAEKEKERARLKKIQLAESDYYKQLINRAMQSVVYPRRAFERGQEGLVKVRINIDKDGNLKDAQMIQSSEINILDAAAVMSAKRAQPYPKVPDLVATNNDTLEFTIPYRFKAQ